MYHVVIIDDEPIIVEGISKLVPWEKYGCMVTACAYDGKEGLTIIREKKPDIIIGAGDREDLRQSVAFK